MESGSHITMCNSPILLKEKHLIILPKHEQGEDSIDTYRFISFTR